MYDAASGDACHRPIHLRLNRPVYQPRPAILSPSGMVVTLILVILILNAMAIVLRSRVFKKLKGH